MYTTIRLTPNSNTNRNRGVRLQTITLQPPGLGHVRNMPFNMHFTTPPVSHDLPGINIGHGTMCDFEDNLLVQTWYHTPHSQRIQGQR